MAKKKIKKTRTVEVTPVPAPQTVPDPGKKSWERVFPFAITAVFLILSLIGILHHEMWRDEYQAWMVAADAHSLPQLYQNMKYEGNPMLWHLFLFVLSAITDDQFSMQLFHILISTTFIFLINRYAPFTILQKVLLTFGYFTFFEYNLISRSYGLGFLLVMLFCVLYQERRKYIWWMAGILFLLANCTIFGVILATGLAGLIVLERITAKKKSSRAPVPWPKVIAFSGISLAGVIIGYLQIRPEPDNTFWTGYVTVFDMTRLKLAFSQMIESYFAIPDVREFHFWNTNFFVSGTEDFLLIAMPLLLVLCLFTFIRNAKVALTYLIVTLTLLFFHYYSGLVWSRYTGHLWITYVACQWLVSTYPIAVQKSNLIHRATRLSETIRPHLFTFILFIGTIGGVYSYIMDLKHPFSTSEQATAFIKANGLDSFELIGTKDYTISPITSQLGKKIFYAERQDYGSFIIYDMNRISINGIREVIPLFERFYREGHKRTIMIKDRPVMLTYDDTGESILWEDARLTDHLNLKLLTTIKPGIVADESYYIYSIDEDLK